MDNVNGKLTAFFEDPFWVGVFEYIEDGKLSVAKVTFGAEPKDYEVLEYIQKFYYRLQFSPAVETVVKEAKRVEGKKTISIETEERDVWRFSGFERVNVKLNQSVREGEVLGSVGTSSGSSIDISIL